jgi:hypothetical protein
LVQNDAASPNGESLASRIACVSATFMIGSVGPNVSSVMQAIVWSTSTSMVRRVEPPGAGAQIRPATPSLPWRARRRRALRLPALNVDLAVAADEARASDRTSARFSSERQAVATIPTAIRLLAA